MISCIICSRQKDITVELKENISSTIGYEYELVVIDNSKNEYSIFSAYNEGINRSRGDILCFMHEDVLYHTKGWGKIVSKVFDEVNIGVVGLIGSQFLPRTAAPWWLCTSTKGQILQGYTDENGTYRSIKDGKKISEVEDVVVVDGFWFCVKKDITLKTKFDVDTYNSFHCYDLDYCMQILEMGKRVVVVPNLLVEHFSLGNINDLYYDQLRLFHRKWQEKLPKWCGIEISQEVALWINELLEGYQSAVYRNMIFKNMKSYKLKHSMLLVLKKIVKWMKKMYNTYSL